MIAYFIMCVLYCATFVAFMQTNNLNPKYWDVYQYSDPSWKVESIVLCIVGTFFWPGIILFLIFHRIAFKILNKNKNK